MHVDPILTEFMWFWVEHEVILCRAKCGVIERSGHATNAIEICAREMWERTWEIKLRRGVGEKKNYSNGV
jgi:hypothetical protein